MQTAIRVLPGYACTVMGLRHHHRFSSLGLTRKCGLVVVVVWSQASRDLLQRYEARDGAAHAAIKPRKKAKVTGQTSDRQPSRPRRGAAASEAMEVSEDEEDEGEDPDDDDDDESGGSETEEEEQAAGRRKRRRGQGAKAAGSSSKARGGGGGVRFHVLITSFEIASKDSSFFQKIDWQVGREGGREDQCRGLAWR